MSEKIKIDGFKKVISNTKFFRAHLWSSRNKLLGTFHVYHCGDESHLYFASVDNKTKIEIVDDNTTF
jgi:hypothetical protein